jgi:hypothetical protein
VYEDSFFPTSSPTFVVGGILDVSNSNSYEWNLSVVLICIELLSKKEKQFMLIPFIAVSVCISND